MVKALLRNAHGHGFKPRPKQILNFGFHVHRNVKLYIADMYVLYTLSDQACTRTCMSIHVCFCIYMSEHVIF